MTEQLVVTASEAAKLLKIDKNKLAEQLASGEIPAYRDGWNWKIPKTLLQAYIENKAIEESRVRRKAHEEAQKQKD